MKNLFRKQNEHYENFKSLGILKTKCKTEDEFFKVKKAADEEFKKYEFYKKLNEARKKKC